MPKNTRWIICYDFETDLPNAEECNPVQLAAVPIHPETLEVKKDQSFSVMIKPPGMDKDEYMTPEREKTVTWHANNYGISNEEVLEKWRGGVAQKVAWKNFCTYCSKYEVDKRPGQWFPAPIPAGYNIIGFDSIIVDRLCKKHKTKNPFSVVNKLDVMDNIFWWFENLDEPFDLKLDTLRKFLSIKLKGGIAHDALTDVYEESALVTRFLKFHRKQASVDKFKNSFAGVEI
jgi:hypothetical protein